MLTAGSLRKHGVPRYSPFPSGRGPIIVAVSWVAKHPADFWERIYLGGSLQQPMVRPQSVNRGFGLTRIECHGHDGCIHFCPANLAPYQTYLEIPGRHREGSRLNNATLKAQHVAFEVCRPTLSWHLRKRKHSRLQALQPLCRAVPGVICPTAPAMWSGRSRDDSPRRMQRQERLPPLHTAGGEHVPPSGSSRSNQRCG